MVSLVPITGSSSSEPVSEFPCVDDVWVGFEPTGHLGFFSVDSRRAFLRCRKESTSVTAVLARVPPRRAQAMSSNELVPQLRSLAWGHVLLSPWPRASFTGIFSFFNDKILQNVPVIQECSP